MNRQCEASTNSELCGCNKAASLSGGCFLYSAWLSGVEGVRVEDLADGDLDAGVSLRGPVHRLVDAKQTFGRNVFCEIDRTCHFLAPFHFWNTLQFYTSPDTCPASRTKAFIE